MTTPAQILGLAQDGHIDRAEMMRRLREITYTHGLYDPTGGDGYLRGTWDQIEEAAGQGLLTDEEYETLARHHRTQANDSGR